jgi:hypothetical protein
MELSKISQNDSVSVTAGNILLIDALANDSPTGVVLDAIVRFPTKGGRS